MHLKKITLNTTYSPHLVIIIRCPIPAFGGRDYRFCLNWFLIIVQQREITDWEQEEVVIQVGEDFFWTEFETKIQTKNQHGRSHNSSIIVVHSAMGSTYNYMYQPATARNTETSVKNNFDENMVNAGIIEVF